MGLFDKLFPAKTALTKLEEDEKRIAKEGNEKQRVALAIDERTSQEILYYLALNDPSKKVRKATAANPSTPMQATTLLAKDRDNDVRFVIARRLVKILPSLSEDKYSQLYAFAVQSLGMLALDEVLKIRRALSETLKDYAQTPPELAIQLAKDLEQEVSEPILLFCAALNDDDLIDILSTHPANWAAEAVARREKVSDRVSRAVIDTGNIQAGKYLLANDGAEISVGLLEIIVERAREYPEWHKPIASRKTLPPLMARKLAAYVDKTVKKILTERSDLDKDTISEIGEIIQRRMEFEETRRKSIDHSDPFGRARKLYDAHGITEEVVADAVAMRDRAFVIACLALMADTSIDNIEKVFDVKAPRSICAVTWRCGFSMRLALKLQQTLGGVRTSALIYPRYGTDYPISEDELRWQLGVIGIA